MASFLDQLNESLLGSPYLLPTDEVGMQKAALINGRTVDISKRLTDLSHAMALELSRVQSEIRTSLRVRLVYESNAIEGIDVSLRDTEETIREAEARTTNHSILAGYTLTQTLANEPKVIDVLGLHEAHLFANELAKQRKTPLHEVDIRNLHRLILGTDPISGAYKQRPNRIAGSELRTSHHADVAKHMHDFVAWINQWQGGPAPLMATVVHAWLTNIHPFEDGNGRMARLLANLILSRYNWPPLIVKSTSDRGEYLEALATSDEGGNILPLLDLFVKALDRVLTEMEKPGFVQELIEADLLGTSDSRYGYWLSAFNEFQSELYQALLRKGFELNVVGELAASDYKLLEMRDKSGNGWWAKVRQRGSRADSLLWFGYMSNSMIDLANVSGHYPSIFVSERDQSAIALHPYRPLADTGRFPIDEILIKPTHPRSVIVRSSSSVSTVGISKAVQWLANAFSTFSSKAS